MSAKIRALIDGSSTPTITVIDGGSGHAVGDTVTFGNITHRRKHGTRWWYVKHNYQCCIKAQLVMLFMLKTEFTEKIYL